MFIQKDIAMLNYRFLFVAVTFLPFWVAAPAGVWAATTYWIDTAGSNENDCTETAPCQTISHALTLAGDGDVIRIYPGIYREQLEIPFTNFTLEGVGEGVQLYGATRPELREADGLYVADWSWGTSFQGTTFCENLTADVALASGHCNTLGFWQAGERLEQVLSRSEVAAGTFYYDFAAGQVWLLPLNGTGVDQIEGATHPWVVRLTPESRQVTLRQIDIWYGASMPDDGILQVEGSEHTLVDVEVRYSPGAGILVYGADQVYMENVRASHHGQNGWRVRADASFSTGAGWTINDWVDELQVVASSSQNNGWKGYDNCWGGGGTKFSFARDLVIDAFYSADNNGFGIWLDIENHDYTIRNAMSARDAGRGIFVEYISDNGLVENNVVFGTKDADAIGCGISVGLAAADSRNVVLKNNTVYATEPDVKALMLKTGCATCRSFPYPSEYVSWENNLVVNKASAGFVRDLDAGSNDTFSYTGTLIEEQYAGDGSVVVCWDTFGGCTTSLLGVEPLQPGDYLADPTSECGFQQEGEAVAGVGALDFSHPAGDAVCGETPALVPPVAGFSFATSALTVTLTDESTDDGQVVLWSWELGDGNLSSDQHPVHTYAAAGAYPVSLTVTDDDGLTDTITKSVTVELPDVPSPPAAAFDYSISGLSVTFTDSSEDDGEIVGWDWQFGDGAVSGAQHPVHTYESAGAYDVTLVVTDDEGLSAEIQQPVEVSDLPPDDTPPAPAFSFAVDAFEVAFLDESSDTDGTIVSWDWDFGDGATSSSQHPVHTYAAAGAYSVALTVADDTGLMATAVDTVEVFDEAEEAGAFIEQNGLLVMEAEHFSLKFAHVETGDAWAQQAEESVVSMQALPDDGDLILADYTVGNAELQYQVVFESTGTFYVWLRLWALEDGRAVYVGSGVQSTRIGVAAQEVPSTAWTWQGHKNPDRPAQVFIDQAGEKTFSIWMREDGLSIDRIILTTDPAYIPEGIGPAESPRSALVTSRIFPSPPDLPDPGPGQRPEKLQVHGVYPNPAAAGATLIVDVAEAGVAAGGIYDMLGRRVMRVEPQAITAGLHQKILLDTSSLSPGVYLYRIRIDGKAGSNYIAGRLVAAG